MSKHPLTIIINQGSGHEEKDRLREVIAAALEKAGHPHRFVTFARGDDVEAVCRKAVLMAREEGGVAVAAGGDGTVNTVGGLCREHGVTMGVIPLGTFNYFARIMNIPLELDAALHVLMQGRVTQATVATVQDRIFLNNAGIGLYARMIRNREIDKARFGRYRLVALLSAVNSLFTHRKIYHIRLKTAAKEVERDTTMVFVGVNSFQMDNLGLRNARKPEQDKLGVAVLRPTSRWQSARLLFWGLMRSMASEERLEEFSAEDILLETPQKTIDVVVDGEIAHMQTPLRFRIWPRSLPVVCGPAPEAAQV